MAAHLTEPVRQDLRQHTLARTVIKDRRWLDRLQLQVYREAVSLLGPYSGPRPVESEAPLVVAPDDFLQFGAAQREIVLPARRKQLIHIDPSTGFQFQAEASGTVAQMLAQVFTDLDEPLLVQDSRQSI